MKPHPIATLIRLLSRDPDIRRQVQVINATPTVDGVEFEVHDSDGTKYYGFLVPLEKVEGLNVIPDTIDGILKRGGL